MKKYLLCLYILIYCHLSYAQTDTAKAQLNMYGFMDVYYLYNFNRPVNHTMPAFIYNHNKHHEIAVNQAILGAKVTHPTYRAALGFHAGTYVTVNYAGESEPFAKYIYEANIGYKLKDKLWLDAGIFSSYIGYETSISFDMWTLTRPLIAENYPYYQSGIKVSYEPTQKWFLSGLILNGWQNISDNNHNKPLGAQIQYKPSSKVLLNTSLFWGKEKAAIDTITEIANRRSFIDFYGIFQLTNKLSTALYFNIGSQKITAINRTASWFAFTGMIRYKPSVKTALCIRGEYYQDPYGVMILTHTNNGFSTSDISLNVDYFLTEKVLARIEGKTFVSTNKMFLENNTIESNPTFLVAASLSMKF